MDWSKGFTALYHMTRVDPVTWRDVERIEITGGSVDRSDTGLLHSADIDCVNLPYQDEMYIRIYLDARQTGDSAHIALFTGLATTPDDDFKGNVKTNTLACYSVLKPAEDILLDRGWYAPAGIDAAVIINRLLETIPAPVQIDDGAPKLRTSIVADEDDSRLDMVEKILTAINWRMRVTGFGEIVIEPFTAETKATYDPLENDCIETEISVSHDWYSCPNVFRAIDEELTAIARDESDDSPFSIQNRGREIWMQDTSCDLADNESIAQYAMRRLKEEQSRAITASYTRRFNPDIMPGDLIYLKYPQQGLNGVYRVTGQTIDLSGGAPTAEEVSNE